MVIIFVYFIYLNVFFLLRIYTFKNNRISRIKYIKMPLGKIFIFFISFLFFLISHNTRMIVHSTTPITTTSTALFRSFKAIKKREYFDSCFLYNAVHNRNICVDFRLVFRVGHFTSSTNLQFCSQAPKTDFGLYRNPIVRAQLTFNKKFSTVNITNINFETYNN